MYESICSKIKEKRERKRHNAMYNYIDSLITQGYVKSIHTYEGFYYIRILVTRESHPKVSLTIFQYNTKYHSTILNNKNLHQTL
jgi:hypothetical protein